MARQLLHVDHPNSEEIVARQNQLNQRWGDLRERSEAKREELSSAHGVQTYHIECRETVTWIEDKMRVLEQTDELKMDLTGIMTLQRKLTGTVDQLLLQLWLWLLYKKDSSHAMKLSFRYGAGFGSHSSQITILGIRGR